MTRTLMTLLVSVGFSIVASAHPAHEVSIPKEFNEMKTLEGTWEGTTQMEGKEQPVTIVYKVTSGGTALTEEIFSGVKKQEMISVYHKSGNSVEMTHYCSMGNQPHMVLKKSTPTMFAFEMTKPIGVTSMHEPHMHAVTLTLVDSDTLKQEWTNMDNGKKQTVVFNFKRKK